MAGLSVVASGRHPAVSTTRRSSSSANLTEAALDCNIKVGLLVRDRALAASVSSHFRGLIDRRLLRPLPMA